MGEISHNDVKYYVTSKSFQGKFYHFEVIKIVVTRKFNPLLFSNKQQNIKKFRSDCKLVDRNCPEYGMCPVYGELTLKFADLKLIRQKQVAYHLTSFKVKGFVLTVSSDYSSPRW